MNRLHPDDIQAIVEGIARLLRPAPLPDPVAEFEEHRIRNMAREDYAALIDKGLKRKRERRASS